MTVKNYWRTHCFPWSDVEGVGVALQQQGVLPQPALAFKLRGGDAVFAQARPFRQSERQQFQADVLALAPSRVVALQDKARPFGSESRAFEQVPPLVVEAAVRPLSIGSQRGPRATVAGLGSRPTFAQTFAHLS